MRPLDLQSEKYGATGNIPAVGLQNQLGRPRLDRLSLLIRESAQNSWDARLSDNMTVRYGISGWTLNNEQNEFLRNTVFKDIPRGLTLKELLNNDQTPFNVLAVYDRNTKGMGGPTRANEISHDGVMDFVNFLRNIGEPPIRQFGGGTYGYGRAAFYLNSQASTICVHTHCIYHGKGEKRFMAAAMGERFEMGSGPLAGRYTGRHWWGKRSLAGSFWFGSLTKEGIVDPITGDDADGLARALGMPPFKANELGTTILILQPDFSDRAPEEALNQMAKSILLNCWPKMLDREKGEPYMSFCLEWDGNQIEIPEPENTPPFKGFVEAMTNLKARLSGDQLPYYGTVDQVRCYRPTKDLGHISLCQIPVSEQASSADIYDDEWPRAESCHHVALMRKPELVVRYLQGPVLPSNAIQYAGVFLTDEDVDSTFADSEPPSHDNWIPDSLESSQDRTFVRVALRNIKEILRKYTAPPESEYYGEYDIPLGVFSEQLAGLIPGEEGPGGGIQPAPRGGSTTGRGGGTKAAHIKYLDEGILHTVDGRTAVTISFEVEPADESIATEVYLEVGVAVLDGTSIESEPPRGAESPSALSWKGPDGKQIRDTQQILASPSQTGPWSVTVSVPRDTAIDINLRAIPVFEQ